MANMLNNALGSTATGQRRLPAGNCGGGATRRNTNAQNRTRVATITLSSDTTALAFLEDLVVFKAIRVTVTETTDGTHSAWMIASE